MNLLYRSQAERSCADTGRRHQGETDIHISKGRSDRTNARMREGEVMEKDGGAGGGSLQNTPAEQ